MNQSVMRNDNKMPHGSIHINSGNQDSSIMHFEAQLKINESSMPNRESLRVAGD